MDSNEEAWARLQRGETAVRLQPSMNGASVPSRQSHRVGQGMAQLALEQILARCGERKALEMDQLRHLVLCRGVQARMGNEGAQEDVVVLTVRLQRADAGVGEGMLSWSNAWNEAE